MDLDTIDLYGGLSGTNLEIDAFDFGDDIVLSKTYAHLMAPFIMAFSPPGPEGYHPAPWKEAGGGFGFDIDAQLHIPRRFDPPRWFNQLNTIWWFTALLRLRAKPTLTCPIVSTVPFSEASDTNTNIELFPIEVEPRRLAIELTPQQTIDLLGLEWVKKHWRTGGLLMHEREDFNILFQTFDNCSFVRSPPLALLSLWGALENMFSVGRSELRFRLSATIATFLEPPGEARHALQKETAKLYDARSSAAHGRKDTANEALTQSYRLTKRIILRIIEHNYAPLPQELEARLFGG